MSEPRYLQRPVRRCLGGSSYVAVIERHDLTQKKAVPVPCGQSLDFDADDATRRWLWPVLGSEWHLVEFLPIQPNK